MDQTPNEERIGLRRKVVFAEVGSATRAGAVLHRRRQKTGRLERSRTRPGMDTSESAKAGALAERSRGAIPRYRAQVRARDRDRIRPSILREGSIHHAARIQWNWRAHPAAGPTSGGNPNITTACPAIQSWIGLSALARSPAVHTINPTARDHPHRNDGRKAAGQSGA